MSYYLNMEQEEQSGWDIMNEDGNLLTIYQTHDYIRLLIEAQGEGECVFLDYEDAARLRSALALVRGGGSTTGVFQCAHFPTNLTLSLTGEGEDRLLFFTINDVSWPIEFEWRNPAAAIGDVLDRMIDYAEEYEANKVWCTRTYGEWKRMLERAAEWERDHILNQIEWRGFSDDSEVSVWFEDELAADEFSEASLDEHSAPYPQWVRALGELEQDRASDELIEMVREFVDEHDLGHSPLQVIDLSAHFEHSSALERALYFART